MEIKSSGGWLGRWKRFWRKWLQQLLGTSIFHLYLFPLYLGSAHFEWQVTQNCVLFLQTWSHSLCPNFGLATHPQKPIKRIKSVLEIRERRHWERGQRAPTNHSNSHSGSKYKRGPRYVYLMNPSWSVVPHPTTVIWFQFHPGRSHGKLLELFEISLPYKFLF